MPKFNLKPAWQACKAIGRPIGVDRKNNIIHGYVVAQEGPFKSNGRGEFDAKSLATIVALMNANQGGTKSRFTHPDMSNDGLGKFLGRVHNPTLSTAIDARTGKEVKAVRADLHFDKTALETPPSGGRPLGDYVMALAESDPGALSSSIVVKVDEEYRIEKDGTPTLGEDGNPLPPLWRPKDIRASDIVDTGDAVDSMLSAETIDGQTTIEVHSGEFVRLQCNGALWRSSLVHRLGAIPESVQTGDYTVAAIDRGAHETIMSASHLSEEQKVAAMKAAQAYKALLIDGIPKP